MLTNEMLTKYYELINANCHGEVLEEVARDFNLIYYVNIFRSINTIHEMEGHLNYDVLALRDRMKNDLFTCLENMLTDAEYEAIRSIV